MIRRTLVTLVAGMGAGLAALALAAAAHAGGAGGPYGPGPAPACALAGCTLTGPLITPNGSVSAPGLQIGPSQVDGLYHVSSTEDDFAIAGVLSEQFGANFLNATNTAALESVNIDRLPAAGLANGNTIANITFRGTSTTAGTMRNFVRLIGSATIATDGAEVGTLGVSVMKAGTLTSELTVSAPAASVSALTIPDAPFTGGSATTTTPLFYINSGTAPTTWSISGTLLGINAPSGFIGDFLDLHVNGASSVFSLTSAGDLFTSGRLQAGAASAVQWGGRGVLTSPGVGNVQLGALDAASPVAQTLSAQSVVAGTSNTVGVDLTIASGRGTGTGAGGKIKLQTAVTGTTGSTQNGLQTVVSLDGNQHVQYVSAAIPTIGTCGTGSPAITAGSTDVMGEATIGTTATACTISFKIAYATAPFCIVQDLTTLSRLTSYTISTTAIVLTMTSNSGDKVQYDCHGA